MEVVLPSALHRHPGLGVHFRPGIVGCRISLHRTTALSSGFQCMCMRMGMTAAGNNKSTEAQKHHLPSSFTRFPVQYVVVVYTEKRVDYAPRLDSVVVYPLARMNWHVRSRSVDANICHTGRLVTLSGPSRGFPLNICRETCTCLYLRWRTSVQLLLPASPVACCVSCAPFPIASSRTTEHGLH
jgi:hypothetical protein